MEFSRIGEHTIKCVISEEEIADLGFSVEEIVTNSERTQEFMNHIFDMAEQKFETKFDMGVKTVQVEFRSDHTLSLTFSEHPVAEGMMEHLKDIVNGLIHSIPQQKWDEIQKGHWQKKSARKENGEEEEALDIVVMMQFPDMDSVIRFAGQVRMNSIPENALCRYKDAYYLMMDLSESIEEEVRLLSLLTDEYAKQIEVGRPRWAFLQEHAQMILGECAIEQLRELVNG